MNADQRCRSFATAPFCIIAFCLVFCSHAKEQKLNCIEILEHPVVLQHSPNCGTACFISTLLKKGITNKNDDKITQDFGSSGISHDDLIQSFRNFGFKAGHYTPATIEEIHTEALKGTSFIFTWDPPYSSNKLHYSIFEGFDNGWVYYMDPNYGHMKITVAEFLSRWRDDIIWVK
jgi:predicted double-glycine peptidase